MQDRNKIEEFIGDIGVGKVHAISVVKEMLKDGDEAMALKFEEVKAMPERMESPPRCHEFFTVAGFVAYLMKNKTDNSLVLGDVTNYKIIAVLDEKAEKGFELIRLTPQPHPEYTLLMAMIGKQLTITKFAELAKRNRRILGATIEAGQDFAMLMQQITISSAVTACSGAGAKSTNGLMVTTDVKSGTAETAIVDLPDRIEANVPLYIHRPEQKFTLDLTVLANQREAFITADAPELAVLHHQEIRAMLDEVKEELSGEIETSLGCIGHGSWQYNS